MPILYRLSDGVYLLLYKWLKYRVKVVRTNIDNSFPTKSTAEKMTIESDFYRILSDYMVEGIKSFTASKNLILSKGSIVKNDEMWAMAAAKKNIIISVGHVGNQELVNLFLSASSEYPFTVKAAFHALANPYFDKMFHRSRERFGSYLFPMKQTYKAMEDQELGRPSSFFLVNDQSAPPHKSYWTTFLHQDTSFYKGMAVSALQYDWPIFFMHVKRTGRGNFELSFKKICDNPAAIGETEILERHVQFLEENINEDPKIWLWSHKRWKHKRPTKS